MKRKNLLIACVLLVAVVLAGCNQTAPAAPAKEDVAETTVETPITLNMSLLQEPLTFDPGLATDSGSLAVINPLFFGLTELDPETQEPMPALATDWSVSEDSKTWTFTLRQDVPWVRYDQAEGKVAEVKEENGNVRMVTAHDVVFGIQRACDACTASPYAYVLYIIAGCEAANTADVAASDYDELLNDVGVQAIDDFTVQIDLNYGASYFGQIASLWTARPVPAALVAEHADGWTAPEVIQSNGPYALRQWVAGEKAVLVKNPFWYGWREQADVTGNIDVVDMTIFDDPPAAFARYQANELDSTTIPLAELEAIADSQSSFAAEYRAVPDNATSYIGFITPKPAVSDARVRRALSMAIDRQTLVRDILKGGQIPANAFTNPLNFGSTAGDPAVAAWALSEDAGGTGYPAAVEMARQLMTEAGHADGAGLQLVFAFEASEEAETIAQAVSAMWQTAFPEIEVALQPQEWEVFLDTLINPASALEDKPDVYQLAWFADYPHANNWLHEVFSPSQSMNELMLSPDDPQVGDLVVELDATTIAAQTASEAEQIELYKRAEQLLVDEIAAVSPLFYAVSNHLTKPWLTREYNVLPYLHRWSIDTLAKAAAQQ
ncbi:MAG: peptide ABC transporter substrate-binding protein [Anaerolineae bacterium]